MKLFIFSFYLTCGVFVSCDIKTKYSIAQDKMIDIMVDLSYSDDVLRRFPGESKDSVQTELILSLLKIHNVTKDDLQRNLYLYQQDLEIYSSMLTQVRTRLDSIQQTLTTE